mmetsp:Transcript_23247/g.28830  ORF Transcript_23247/g.28830 Transcript_23247/m.28830 type:complete len:156 (-) Transcript_23247:66-533(-)
MVGAPGSGKSTIAVHWMATYERVNNDALKSKEKCMKVCREMLQAGKSVVIDNTNSSQDVRTRYIDIARDFKVPVRCFYMRTDKETCMHNNFQRKANTHRKHLSKAVPSVAIHTYFKNAVKPKLSEGFETIIELDFVADTFDNAEDRQCYDQVRQK